MTAVIVNSLTVLEGDAENTATTNKIKPVLAVPAPKEQTVLKGCQPGIEIAVVTMEVWASKNPQGVCIQRTGQGFSG